MMHEKKNWSKTYKLKIFQFRSVEHRSNTNQVRHKQASKTWKFSIDRKTHLIDRKTHSIDRDFENQNF